MSPMVKEKSVIDDDYKVKLPKEKNDKKTQDKEEKIKLRERETKLEVTTKDDGTISVKKAETPQKAKSAKVLDKGSKELSSVVEERTERIIERSLKLEDIVPDHVPDIPNQNDYVSQLSQESIDALNESLGDLYSSVKEGNELTQYEMQQAQNMQYALTQKQNDVRSGSYNADETFADKFDTAKQMLDKILGSYK